MKLIDELLEGLNKVETALIEIIEEDANKPIQCWYHYNKVKIETFPNDILFIRFFYYSKNVASFGVKISAIKVYRELNMPELKSLAHHYHIVVSNREIDFI